MSDTNKPLVIFTLNITHEYGETAWTFGTHEQMLNKLHAWVETYWSTVFPNKPMPTMHEAIEIYFTKHNIETYSMARTLLNDENGAACYWVNMHGDAIATH